VERRDIVPPGDALILHHRTIWTVPSREQLHCSGSQGASTLRVVYEARLKRHL
jgi:hypothetical protein